MILNESVCVSPFLFFYCCSLCFVGYLFILCCGLLIANKHLDTQNWLGVAVCHPPPTSVLLGIMSDLNLKGQIQDLNCKAALEFFFSLKESVSFATADLWLLICGLGYRTRRPCSQALTAGSPVQYEESPMCLLGVSQLSCLWGGRPRAWTVH